MKKSLQIIVFLVIGLLFSACGQVATATPSPMPSPTKTPPATFTPILGHTPTAIEPTVTKVYVTPTRPTAIPTIDPNEVHGLLSKAFSIETLEGVNGHRIHKITGWNYGFGGGFMYTACSGYSWLDVNHLLLYPAAGQIDLPQQWSSPTKFNVVPQPVIITLKNGHVWLPPLKTPSSSEACATLDWSSELGVLITSEAHDGVSTVSTYTFDGHKLESYAGSLVSVSPGGTKIFLNDNTLIDLRTNRRITFTGNLKYYSEEFYDMFWTSDETRIFRCCYFYADLRTGISYSSQRADFQDTNDNQWESERWLVYRGEWIQNDTYFLPQWNWLDDGDIRQLPMLDPAKKTVVDARMKAGIPEDWSCTDIYSSPDGKYIWMNGFGDSYLVDLITFTAQYFPGQKDPDVYWSRNSKFALLHNNDSSDETEQYAILSMGDKELRPLPIAPLWELHWWHSRDNILIYPEDENTLLLLDAAAMSFRELPFKVDVGGYDSFVWSPRGEKIAFVAEDGSLWQVYYPKLEKPEQLTLPLPNVYSIDWSPDGKSIAFISGSDIYIVDTNK